MDCSPPGSSVHVISQARMLEWVAISFSRGSSQPRDWINISWIGRRILYPWATREALARLPRESKINPLNLGAGGGPCSLKWEYWLLSICSCSGRRTRSALARAQGWWRQQQKRVWCELLSISRLRPPACPPPPAKVFDPLQLHKCLMPLAGQKWGRCWSTETGCRT